jgi:hypothetical protein
MTPQEFIGSREQTDWPLATLSRHIGITASRLADYEDRRTRGKNQKPAPIPRLVDLACKVARTRLPAAEPGRERRAVMRLLAGMPRVDHIIDDRREAPYDPDRGL